MKIEMNKEYLVAPKMKKSFVETCRLTDFNGRVINHEILWRSGEVSVTPTNESEVKELQRLVEDDSFCFNSENFTEYEMVECWDSCSEDFFGDTDLIEEWENMPEEEQDEFFSFTSWLEDEKGFDYEDCVTEIYNGVSINEL